MSIFARNKKLFTEISHFFFKRSKKESIKPIFAGKTSTIAKKKHNLISLSKKGIIELFGKWITTGAEKCRICDIQLRKNNPRQIVFFCSKRCRRKRININY